MTNYLTTTNLPEFARHFIGGDPFARWTSVAQTAGNYPPYNIERIDDDNFRLTLAVAGFSRDEISIERERDVLTVRGSARKDEVQRTFLHRGIALRDFERSFVLGEHVVIRGASMADGMLTVDLAREIPEAAKPVTIAIE